MNPFDIEVGAKIKLNGTIARTGQTTDSWVIALSNGVELLIPTRGLVDDAELVSHPYKPPTEEEVKAMKKELETLRNREAERQLKLKVTGGTIGDALKEYAKNDRNARKNCLHDLCTTCHGSGQRPFGGPCNHMLSCSCEKCTPSMFKSDADFYKSLEQPKTHTLYRFPKSIGEKIDIWLGL